MPWKQKRGKRLPCVKRKPAEVDSCIDGLMGLDGDDVRFFKPNGIAIVMRHAVLIPVC